MRRRAFIAGIGSAAAWPMAARGQPRTLPVIGILSSGLADPSPPFLDAFRQGLTENGYMEGRDVVLQYVWGEEKYDHMPALAANLVASQVALVVAFGNVAARAARAATTTIPVVFLVGSDPVRIGLVESLHRPGTNMTGIHILNTDLETKRLELLMEVIPQADSIAFLVNPDSPTTEMKLQDLRRAASAIDRKLLILKARTADDFDTAFTFPTEQPKGLIIASDNMFGNHSKELGRLAALRHLPAIAAYRNFATAGGLMSYGTNADEANRQVGIYAGRILKGAKPTELPVVQSAKVEFVLNLKSAKALSITVSLPLLGRADEVIE